MTNYPLSDGQLKITIRPNPSFTLKFFVVVYKCTISNVMFPLGILKHFCIARFTLCQNVRNTLALSWDLTNFQIVCTSLTVRRCWVTVSRLRYPFYKLWSTDYLFSCLSRKFTYMYSICMDSWTHRSMTHRPIDYLIDCTTRLENSGLRTTSAQSLSRQFTYI